MAFAKRTLHGSPSTQGFNPSSIEILGFKGHHSSMLGGGGCSEPLENYEARHHPTPFDSSSWSSCFTFGSVNDPPVEDQSIANSRRVADHRACSSSSVFSFEQGDRVLHANDDSRPDDEEECANWIDAMDRSYQMNHYEMASGYGLINCMMKENHHEQERFGLLCPTTTAVDNLQKSVGQERASHKRPYMDRDMQALKKQCSNATKTKSKPTSSKDPQSIAAKNRRERISERLKILQELVPNGTKVDLVTMLDKAISYVKFLQLQVKVLATDEFWPAQGGKAPEVAQVKEAIDAILSSYRDRNSSSKQ